jgi:hypothetical protein
MPRDRALKEGEDALNNQNVEKYSADSQARFGCKGKSKFCFGYKGYLSVDMGSNMIDTVAVTLANISDQKGVAYIVPRNGEIVFGYKLGLS